MTSTSHIRRPAAPGSSAHRTFAPLDQPPAADTTGHVTAGEPRQRGSTSGNKPASKRLHRKQAAEYLGLSLSWLDKARLRGTGPVYLQIGGRIVYDTADLDRFMTECRRRSTSEVP